MFLIDGGAGPGPPFPGPRFPPVSRTARSPGDTGAAAGGSVRRRCPRVSEAQPPRAWQAFLSRAVVAPAGPRPAPAGLCFWLNSDWVQPAAPWERAGELCVQGPGRRPPGQTLRAGTGADAEGFPRPPARPSLPLPSPWHMGRVLVLGARGVQGAGQAREQGPGPSWGQPPEGGEGSQQQGASQLRLGLATFPNRWETRVELFPHAGLCHMRAALPLGAPSSRGESGAQTVLL